MSLDPEPQELAAGFGRHAPWTVALLRVAQEQIGRVGGSEQAMAFCGTEPALGMAAASVWDPLVLRVARCVALACRWEDGWDGEQLRAQGSASWWLRLMDLASDEARGFDALVAAASVAVQAACMHQRPATDGEGAAGEQRQQAGTASAGHSGAQRAAAGDAVWELTQGRAAAALGQAGCSRRDSLKGGQAVAHLVHVWRFPEAVALAAVRPEPGQAGGRGALTLAELARRDERALLVLDLLYDVVQLDGGEAWE